MMNDQDGEDSNHFPRTVGERLINGLEELLGAMIGITFLSSLAILAYQAYGWLRSGHWEPIPLSKVWLYFFGVLPTTDWVGLQTIMNFILRIEISIVVPCVFFVIILSSFQVIENYREKNRSWS